MLWSFLEVVSPGWGEISLWLNTNKQQNLKLKETQRGVHKKRQRTRTSSVFIKKKEGAWKQPSTSSSCHIWRSGAFLLAYRRSCSIASLKIKTTLSPPDLTLGTTQEAQTCTLFPWKPLCTSQKGDRNQRHTEKTPQAGDNRLLMNLLLFSHKEMKNSTTAIALLLPAREAARSNPACVWISLWALKMYVCSACMGFERWVYRKCHAANPFDSAKQVPRHGSQWWMMQTHGSQTPTSSGADALQH